MTQELTITDAAILRLLGNDRLTTTDIANSLDMDFHETLQCCIDLLDARLVTIEAVPGGRNGIEFTWRRNTP